jgi:hypothetical protein
MSALVLPCRQRFAVLLTAGILAMGLSAPCAAQDDDAEDDDVSGGFCVKSAELALSACEHGVRDDHGIALGRCYNTADENARQTCIAAANAERDEGPEDCEDQFDARLELCDALGTAPYDPPEFVGGNFVDPLQIGRSVRPNPYFPLDPGRKWVYRSEDETVTVEVLGQVIRIAGVPCTVVRDIVTEDGGRTVEDTMDWFAQHRDGTVWYCGEISAEYENGQIVGFEGSWRAGTDNARAGKIMPINPRVGEIYRQEFALGDAEDVGQVISITGSESAPAASCDGRCVVTRDFTPLEPDALEHKYYASGVGLILEVKPETGERLELVELTVP